jgi:hypothetical protein
MVRESNHVVCYPDAMLYLYSYSQPMLAQPLCDPMFVALLGALGVAVPGSHLNLIQTRGIQKSYKHSSSQPIKKIGA